MQGCCGTIAEARYAKAFKYMMIISLTFLTVIDVLCFVLMTLSTPSAWATFDANTVSS